MQQLQQRALPSLSRVSPTKKEHAAVSLGRTKFKPFRLVVNIHCFLFIRGRCVAVHPVLGRELIPTRYGAVNLPTCTWTIRDQVGAGPTHQTRPETVPA